MCDIPSYMHFINQAGKHEATSVFRNGFYISVDRGRDVLERQSFPFINKLEYLDTAVIGDAFEVTLKLLRRLFPHLSHCTFLS